MAQQPKDQTLHLGPLQPSPQCRRRRQPLEQRRRLLNLELLGRGGERGGEGGHVRGLPGRGIEFTRCSQQGSVECGRRGRAGVLHALFTARMARCGVSEGDVGPKGV